MKWYAPSYTQTLDEHWKAAAKESYEENVCTKAREKERKTETDTSERYERIRVLSCSEECFMWEGISTETKRRWWVIGVRLIDCLSDWLAVHESDGRYRRSRRVVMTLTSRAPPVKNTARMIQCENAIFSLLPNDDVDDADDKLDIETRGKNAITYGNPGDFRWTTDLPRRGGGGGPATEWVWTRMNRIRIVAWSVLRLVSVPSWVSALCCRCYFFSSAIFFYPPITFFTITILRIIIGIIIVGVVNIINEWSLSWTMSFLSPVPF